MCACAAQVVTHMRAGLVFDFSRRHLKPISRCTTLPACLTTFTWGFRPHANVYQNESSSVEHLLSCRHTHTSYLSLTINIPSPPVRVRDSDLRISCHDCVNWQTGYLCAASISEPSVSRGGGVCTTLPVVFSLSVGEGGGVLVSSVTIELVCAGVVPEAHQRYHDESPSDGPPDLSRISSRTYSA